MPYIPHTPDEQKDMLAAIGLPDMAALFADIPEALRPKDLAIPHGQSEMEVLAHLEELASRNSTHLTSFLGAGFYDHYSPAAIKALASRGEFFTAYTPYQPEASQGTLQAIFEYQSSICRLLDMEYANASLYDGGTALYEAMMMAVRITKKRSKILVCEGVNPIYRTMLDSYTSNLHLELMTVPHKNGLTDMQAMMDKLDEDIAAVIVQNPNFFGSANDYTQLFEAARHKGVVSILSVYPVMQSVLKTPGEMGADIAVAEGQSLGLPLSFGGPYLGIMTCTKPLIRQMPGRIVGRTEDVDGRTGYVLTLQAREQHIRRHKATSNICSNQSLCALCSLMYLALLGPEGLKRTAELSIQQAHYAAERLTALPGVDLCNKAPFTNECVLSLPCKASRVINALVDKQFIPGFPLGRYYQDMDNMLLVACTEKTSNQAIGILAELMGGVL
ncbi:MAG: aminomethyl-transferring glycine dehydrogenase [Deltaproteobacteria bacterium]|nr:MAG: aminomethyl-transferring glycine dehydrogenase [Deltaproteobacteria bacterium]